MIDRILLDGNGVSLKLYLASKGIEAILDTDESSGTQIIRYAPEDEPVVDAWLAGYVTGWS